MKKWILKQFDYNFWANKEIIDFLKACNNQDKSIIKLLSHVIAYQDLWYEKMKKHIEYNVDINEYYTIFECDVLNKQSYNKWKNLLKFKSKKKLEDTVTVRDDDKIPGEEPLIDVLMRVITHSVHHRGQIMKLLSGNDTLPDISYEKYLSLDREFSS